MFPDETRNPRLGSPNTSMLFGSRQSGLPTLRMASLTGDMRTLRAAQDEAAALLAEDPGLRLPAHAALKAAVGGLFSGEAGNRFN